MTLNTQHTSFYDTSAHGFAPAPESDLGITWEDCDTLITNATAANGGTLRGLDKDMSLIYNHPQPSMLPHQQQQPANTQVQDYFPSDSPSSFSSQTTMMNMQNHNSPAFTSPPMTDIQIKVEKYLADGIDQTNGLFSNVQPPQHEVPNLSPPTTQNLPSTRASSSKRRKAPGSRTNDIRQNDLDDGNINDLNNNDIEEEDIIVKRKAQNRAAQRAFRERKEQRVRELEQKLGESEKEKLRLASENERLKKENTVITTENQVLMATTTSSSDRSNGITSAPLKANFPVHKFSNLLLAEHDKKFSNKIVTTTPSYVVYEKNAGDTMLGAGAVWEQIMQEPDNEDIDVERVMSFLRGKEYCDGFGPVFRLQDVKTGILLARGQ